MTRPALVLMAATLLGSCEKKAPPVAAAAASAPEPSSAPAKRKAAPVDPAKRARCEAVADELSALGAALGAAMLNEPFLVRTDGAWLVVDDEQVVAFPLDF